MKVIKFKGFECYPHLAQYANGRLALILRDVKDGGDVAIASVNIPEFPITGSQMFIKDYGENEGIEEVLKEAGILKAEVAILVHEFINIPLWEIDIPKLIEAQEIREEEIEKKLTKN